MHKKFILFLKIALVITAIAAGRSYAAKPWEEDDIIRTKHNLSSSGPGTTKTTESEICVFCHTPHAANNDGPLWNRNLKYQDQAAYTMYKGSQIYPEYKGSLDAETSDKPKGYSKLCLSCHDGTIALNNLINKPGSGGHTPGDGSVIGGDSNALFMPAGKGELSGDTRRLGTDLSNDHPISFRVTQRLIDDDKEIAPPTKIAPPYDGNCDHNYADCKPDPWIRQEGVRLYPLDFNDTEKNAVQCTSCHNPHTTNTKFLRGSRMNETPGDDTNRTQICEACHPKPGWVNSTHENNLSSYRGGNALPELDGGTVAQHGCLNCHDPHTLQGADRLHRNGAAEADKTYTGIDVASGKTPAIENTCFQCHINLDGSVNVPNLSTPNFVQRKRAGGPPDIKGVFDKNKHQTPVTGDGNFKEMGVNADGSGSLGSSMPLDRSWANSAGGSTNGEHSPIFISEATLDNRYSNNSQEEQVLNKPQREFVHVECVDCHNPHQVNKYNRFKGMKGINIDGEIIGGDSVTKASDGRKSYDAQGLAGKINEEPLVYEICLRCHGDSYTYNMPFRAKGASFVSFGNSEGERDRGHVYNPDLNSGGQFGASNKRKEFNINTGGKSRTNSDDSLPEIFNYNPSYHPVAAPGRNGTVALYNQLMKAFKLCNADDNGNMPENAQLRTCYDSDYLNQGGVARAASVLGKLTMQCTDCHNSSDLNNPNLSMDSPAGIYGPITGLPDGSSYRRPTDRPSNLTSSDSNNPAKAQGPHGSVNPRILRAPYVTNLLPHTMNLSVYITKDGTTGQYVPADGIEAPIRKPFENFGLCFQCHEYNVFLGQKVIGQNRVIGTNFGSQIPAAGSADWSANLHYYHLLGTKAYCHECHNNVHSNAEANNTIYGEGGLGDDGIWGGLPPDGEHDGITDGMIDTHLLNFGPQALPANSRYPRWYYDSGEGKFRCDINCHGLNMSACYYSHTASGDNNSGTNANCGPGWHLVPVTIPVVP